MKSLAFILAIAAALAPASFARLGETPEQLIQRYGAPIERDVEYLVFKQGAFTIFAEMDQGGCDGLTYSKSEKPQPGTRPSISKEQLEWLLQSHAGGSTWGKPQQMELETAIWERADKVAYALYNSGGDFIIRKSSPVGTAY